MKDIKTQMLSIVNGKTLVVEVATYLSGESPFSTEYTDVMGMKRMFITNLLCGAILRVANTPNLENFQSNTIQNMITSTFREDLLESVRSNPLMFPKTVRGWCSGILLEMMNKASQDYQDYLTKLNTSEQPSLPNPEPVPEPEMPVMDGKYTLTRCPTCKKMGRLTVRKTRRGYVECVMHRNRARATGWEQHEQRTLKEREFNILAIKYNSRVKNKEKILESIKGNVEVAPTTS